MSALSLAALAVAQAELAAGVRGGVAPFARFRGLRVDEYQRAVRLPLPPDPTVEGNPWCAAAVYWCFERAVEDAGDVYVPCPRTAGALHLWDSAPAAARVQEPEPGAVFVLDRGKGRGHVGFVLTASDHAITTVEPDTANTTLSATGDAWGQHLWSPADGVRGTLLGYMVL